MPTIKDTQAAGAAEEKHVFWREDAEQFCIHPAGKRPMFRGWERLYTHAQALALASTAPTAAIANAAPSFLTYEQWYDLAQRHATRDWNADGYLDSVKALCRDFASTATAPSAPDSAAPSSLSAEPMQPIVMVDGVARFRENRIVSRFLEISRAHGFGLNEAARGDYTPEEHMQVAQLIGYSVSGYGSLSYVTDDSYNRAAVLVDALTPPAQAPAIQAPEAVVTETSAVWSAIADYMMANEALQRRRAEGHLMNAEWIDAVQNAATVVDAAIFALATPSAAVSAEPDHTPDPEIPITRSLLVAAVGELAKYALPAGSDDQVIANLAAACGIPVPSAAVSAAGPRAPEYVAPYLGPVHAPSGKVELYPTQYRAALLEWHRRGWDAAIKAATPTQPQQGTP